MGIPAHAGFFVPPALAERGVNSVHPYPLVMDLEKTPKGRRPAPVAWREFPRVELQPPNCYAAILLDVDDPRDEGWPYDDRESPQRG